MTGYDGYRKEGFIVMSKNGISPEALDRMSENFHADRANEVAATAAVNNGII